MTTKKSTSLSSSLLVRRKPAPAGSAPAPAATQPDGQQPAKASARPRATYAKALTLKLDQGRYQALKLEGIKSGKSGQRILIEALDGWLERAATSPSK